MITVIETGVEENLQTKVAVELGAFMKIHPGDVYRLEEMCKSFVNRILREYSSSGLILLMEQCRHIAGTECDKVLRTQFAKYSVTGTVMNVCDRLLTNRKENKTENRIVVTSIEPVSQSNICQVMDILIKLPKSEIETTVNAMVMEINGNGDTELLMDLAKYCAEMHYNGEYEGKYNYIEKIILATICQV